MKLVSIPKFDDYRLDAIFDCYKWDPQFKDSNTLSKYALVLTEKEYKEIKQLTEKLDQETIMAEEFLNKNQNLAKPLNLPKKISNELKRMSNYDFHLDINNNWVISEVNSDVPGGFAESSLLPKLAIKYLKKDYTSINFGDILASNIEKKIKGKNIMFVHCTSYSDDRQVMEFVGDRLAANGYKILKGAADHIAFKAGKAYSILDGNECELDGIFRYTPVEWVMDIKPKRWQGYFNTRIPCCSTCLAAVRLF